MQWIEKEMVPKMLLHVESVLNYLEDLEYRNELSNTIGKYISTNINAVCEEVTQLMVLDNVISENIITEIVRLKPSHAGQILSDWCKKSEKNIIFIFENNDRFDMRCIFPDTEPFQSFINVLMSKVNVLGVEGMKHIVDLQNSYYAHDFQKQQSNAKPKPKSKPKMEVPPRENIKSPSPTRSESSFKSKSSKRSKSSKKSAGSHEKATNDRKNISDNKKVQPASTVSKGSEEVKKSGGSPKANHGISKQKKCSTGTEEPKIKDKNKSEHAKQFTSEIRKSKSNQKPSKVDDKSHEEITDASLQELLKLVWLTPQKHQKNKFFSVIFLRSRVWQTFSFADMSDLSQNGAISCYTFMDLIIEWLESHQTPEKKFNILWGNVNIKRLSYTFLLDLKNHLKSNCGFNLSKLPQKKDFETTDETEVLSKTVTAEEFKKLTSRQVIHLSTSKCPVVGCQAPSTVEFYVLLQLSDQNPAVLPQDEVDRSQVVFNSGHIHPDNVLHWYAVISDTNRIIPLNLTPVDELEQKLAGASNVTVKCVISCNGVVRDSNNSKETNLTELRKLEMLTLPSYQLSQSIEDLLRTKFIGISPYQYIELCTQWIESRKPKKDLFDVILSSFPIDKVSKEFMSCIDLKLTSLTYTINFPKIAAPTRSTAEISLDIDLEDLLLYDDKSKPFDFSFKYDYDKEFTVTIFFYSSAPIVRIQKVIMNPRDEFSFIRVCHVYFKIVSNKGNSSFVSILSNEKDEFIDILLSRKKRFILFDYYMINKSANVSK